MRSGLGLKMVCDVWFVFKRYRNIYTGTEALDIDCFASVLVTRAAEYLRGGEVNL